MLFKQPADGETPGMDLKKLKSAASEYNSGSERSYMGKNTFNLLFVLSNITTRSATRPLAKSKFSYVFTVVMP